MSVEMKIKGLMIDPVSNMPIIILKNPAGDSVLPIWVGIFEANAIAMQLEDIVSPRPMTHDLLKHILESVEVHVAKIEVNDLSDNTFYARLTLVHADKDIVVDARPSDAIAIALRTGAPIYVAKKVIDKSRKIDLAEESGDEASRKQKWTEILENLSPEDFGKYKM